MTSRSSIRREHRDRLVSRRTALASIAALPLAAALPGCGGDDDDPPGGVQPADFTLLATDFTDGVQFIDGNVRIAINASGQVAFVATELPPPVSGFSQAVFVSQPAGPLAKLPSESLGFIDVDALQIASGGDVAFVATRAGMAPLRGVYRGNPITDTITALYEADPAWSFGDPGGPPPQSRLSMSANDTLAFSTLVSSAGGIYRSPLAGPPVLLRGGTGVYFNNQAFAVNNAGAVVVQMEYGDPNAGLRRGLLVFDTPGDTLETIESAGERASIGWQPRVAINNAGQVAFTTGFDITIQYFTPPLPGGGAPSSTQTIPAGVHLATPTAFGLPFTFTTIATPADGYSNFGDVAVNDAGTVVFTAGYGGNSGVFFGADPIGQRVAITGEDITIGGALQFFSVVRLGGLNGANQVAIQTSDFRTTDQKIWRVQLPLA
jgi:hypothetical protein